jgi:excisionase family DNA binding protein
MCGRRAGRLRGRGFLKFSGFGLIPWRWRNERGGFFTVGGVCLGFCRGDQSGAFFGGADLEAGAMIEKHYSPTELAKILGISRAGMHLRLHDGTFGHVRLGDRVLIPESEVQRVLDQCRIEGAHARPARPAHRRNLFAHA